MTIQKFREMKDIQSEFFKERLQANLRILGLEIEMKEEDVIKSNNKDKKEILDKFSIKKSIENPTKILEVKMLNSLLQYNDLISK